MKQTCPCCSRPYDDEWAIYCPVSRQLAEQLRGDGLTSKGPVNVRLDVTDEMIMTEIRIELIDGQVADA